MWGALPTAWFCTSVAGNMRRFQTKTTHPNAGNLQPRTTPSIILAAKKFYEIESTLREDTSISKNQTQSASQARVPGSERDHEDEDIEEPDGHPAWLDDSEKIEHCGSAETFVVEVYVNLESSILRDLLSSDGPDRSDVQESKMGEDRAEKGAGAEPGDSADEGGEVDWEFDSDV
ncbi:uncharacterized protein B0H18DRAFT_953950 [Fomitopsis serialis]|uniref:uncharacterized protein n=1 Tax=Fomitopsis serialis TaxID=139415 RepID=UPI0020073272|nr:uncharacterized protein B0H18DRAFT_953950 [Neoantrodia serialis]KAH9928728.1 hypothetical protein B0H18DRAFT_953950 [Neoantrodia serialis]